MNDNEYAVLQNKLRDAGIPQQTYVIEAIKGSTITPSEEISALKGINATFADLDRQLRGMAANVNQMACIANTRRYAPGIRQLKRISQQIDDFRKEVYPIWQSIRQSITRRSGIGE